MTSSNSVSADGVAGYRAYVDGLRAIAIVSVVAAHVGVPGLSGGFVGVDVFFVISGYLIIGQIVDALRKRTFSFSGFWMRRVLRIVPPMAAMLVASILIAHFVLVTPAEFREFGQQVLYAALMVVNFYFLDAQNYFDTEAVLKPLLHMWSLAVEEQFYLLAPLVLVFGWKLRFRTALMLTAALFLISLAACIALTNPSKNVAFYVVFCRAWEFIAGGAVLAMRRPLSGLSDAALEAIAVGGILAVAAAVASFSEADMFPSYLAILPVAGTAMVIAAGSTGAQLYSTRLLGSWPLVAIGLVSYAWYLWHWPLLSFTRIQNFGDANLARDLVAVFVAFVAAVASYFVIERPCRRLRHSAFVTRASRTVIMAGALATIVIGVGATFYGSKAAKSAERTIAEAMRPGKNTKLIRGDACWMSDPKTLSDKCVAAIGEKRAVVLLGDSHARMLYPALKEAADKQGMTLVSLWQTGCSPFHREEGSLLDARSADCDDYAQVGLQTLKRTLPTPPEAVVIGGYWQKLAHGLGYREFLVGREKQPEGSTADRSAQIVRSLTALLDSVNEAGAKRAIVVGPSAEFSRQPVECLARASARGMPPNVCDVGKAAADAWAEPAVSALREAVRGRPNATLIEAMDVFCSGDLCRPSEDGVIDFTDTHHVSPRGARKIMDASNALSLFDPAKAASAR